MSRRSSRDVVLLAPHAEELTVCSSASRHSHLRLDQVCLDSRKTVRTLRVACGAGVGSTLGLRRSRDPVSLPVRSLSMPTAARVRCALPCPRVTPGLGYTEFGPVTDLSRLMRETCLSAAPVNECAGREWHSTVDVRGGPLKTDEAARRRRSPHHPALEAMACGHDSATRRTKRNESQS